jgi:serine/threonine protein kinase
MWVCPQCHLVFRDQRVGICAVHGTRLVEQEFDPLVGRVVDRYQIMERLGGGAMGSVYRAKHAVLDRQCALKVLYGEYAHDENLRKRFEREAKAVSRIRHPNVVAVSDFGTHDSLTFLVMDYVEGRPLDRIIEEEAPLTPSRTARLARQIAAGLQEAHSQGFVHRDMKPPNVMVGGVRGREDVRILDFGLVSLLYRRIDAERLTIEGQLVGTPMYMSPEQTLDAAVGPRADLYSLGVMMYEMLTSRPPFVHEGRIALMFSHVHQPPPPLPMCGGLEMVVMRLLAKKPEDRFQSAKDLMESLDRLELSDDTSPSRMMHRGMDFGRDSTDPSHRPQLVYRDTDPSIDPNAHDDDEFIEGATQVESIEERSRLPQVLSTERLTILILEDNRADSSDSISRVVDDFSVRHVTDMNATLRALNHESVDAIVIDMSLPELDRMEMLSMIRDAAPKTPLIALSSRASESRALEAAKCGADDFLVKSETPPVALARAIRFAVARGQAILERTSQAEAPRPTVELVAPVSDRHLIQVEHKRPGNVTIAIAVGLFVLGIAAGILGSIAAFGAPTPAPQRNL